MVLFLKLILGSLTGFFSLFYFADVFKGKFRITKRNNGEIVWVQSRAELIIDEITNEKKVVGVIIDISKEAENQKALQYLHVNQLPERKHKNISHYPVWTPGAKLRKVDVESCILNLGSPLFQIFI